MKSDLNIGFVGAGAIAEAFIIGMFEMNAIDGDVIVSARNEVRSSRLAERFERVFIESDNQNIVDRSDWVFVSVLPEQAEQVLLKLNFRPNQYVVSLVAGLPLGEIANHTQPAQAFRIIPMPPIEYGIGPIVLTPPNAELECLLAKLGTPVGVENEDHFSTFSAASAIMASFFELVATQARWMEGYGIPRKQASTYATSLCRALAEMTCHADPEALQKLSRECLTVGGLNEQVLNENENEGWFQQIETRLERIAQRLGMSSDSREQSPGGR